MGVGGGGRGGGRGIKRGWGGGWEGLRVGFRGWWGWFGRAGMCLRVRASRERDMYIVSRERERYIYIVSRERGICIKQRESESKQGAGRRLQHLRSTRALR